MTEEGPIARSPCFAMNNRHVVRLEGRERATLRQRASAGKGRARELLRARILLKADSGPDGPAWTDGTIAAALEVSRSTVERVRKRFAEGGLEAALRRRRPRREYRRSKTAAATYSPGLAAER